ncbi:MAG: hypothetical protein K6T65_06275 [Peptococcaceae bacterium]|nr:hypothetical protein [Peptococcaceae bacterium]
MANAAAGDARLENVMFRLMDWQSGENTDQYDTMVMITLVNLLGIVSAMNKLWSAGPPVTRSLAEDPLMTALLGSLGQEQYRQGGRGGPPGLNPALLLSLLGGQGQRPENALLLALLSSMMQPPAQPPPYSPGPHPFHRPDRVNQRVEKDRPDDLPGPGGGRAGDGKSQHELRRQKNVLTWDRRLG